jgi:hypothetical protein
VVSLNYFDDIHVSSSINHDVISIHIILIFSTVLNSMTPPTKQPTESPTQTPSNQKSHSSMNVLDMWCLLVATCCLLLNVMSAENSVYDRCRGTEFLKHKVVNETFIKVIKKLKNNLLNHQGFNYLKVSQTEKCMERLPPFDEDCDYWGDLSYVLYKRLKEPKISSALSVSRIRDLDAHCCFHL